MGDSKAAWRKTTTIVIGIFCLFAAWRINSVSGPVSDHDRVRWATVAALLERGEASLGRRTTTQIGVHDEGLITSEPWRSVDVVLNPDTRRFYASKPWPVSALAAGVVRPLEWMTGWRLAENTPQVVRWTLAIINLLPFVLYLFALREWMWRQRVSLASALLTLGLIGTSGWYAFLTALTGHSIAAALAGFLMLRLLGSAHRTPRDAWMEGCFAAGIALTEAAGFILVVALIATRMRLGHRRLLLPTIVPCVGAAILFFVGNKLFTDAWVPAYLQTGTLWYQYAGSYWNNPVGIDLGEVSVTRYTWHALIGHHGFFNQTPLFVLAVLGAACRSRWHHPRQVLFGSLVGALALAYLRKLVPLAFGPVELVLVALITGMLLRPSDTPHDDTHHAARIALATCIAGICFYLSHTKNYGGVSSFFRYWIWLGPLLWVFLPAGLERFIETRIPRMLAYALAVMGFVWGSQTALTVVDNPFIHPPGYDPQQHQPQERATRGTYRL